MELDELHLSDGSRVGATKHIDTISVDEGELWIYRNPQALEAIERGLLEARNMNLSSIPELTDNL